MNLFRIDYSEYRLFGYTSENEYNKNNEVSIPYCVCPNDRSFGRNCEEANWNPKKKYTITTSQF